MNMSVFGVERKSTFK